jgi:hypothetical protein
MQLAETTRLPVATVLVNGAVVWPVHVIVGAAAAWKPERHAPVTTVPALTVAAGQSTLLTVSLAPFGLVHMMAGGEGLTEGRCMSKGAASHWPGPDVRAQTRGLTAVLT